MVNSLVLAELQKSDCTPMGSWSMDLQPCCTSRPTDSTYPASKVDPCTPVLELALDHDPGIDAGGGVINEVNEMDASLVLTIWQVRLLKIY